MVINMTIQNIIYIFICYQSFFWQTVQLFEKKTGNQYRLGCTPSEEFTQLAEDLDYIPFSVEVTRNISPFKDLKAVIKIYNYIYVNRQKKRD